MNVSSTSSAIASITASRGASSSQGVAAPDEGAGTARPHRGHGGGHMHQAVMQALQSLGLSPASGTSDSGSAASNSSTSSGSTSDGSDASGSTSSTSSIGQDMRQFMHALFEAVRGESSASSSSSAATSAASGAGDPPSSFASGLAALVSQVTSGSAPADLQSAFTKLADDLQATTASSSASSSTDSTGSGSTDTQASLQAFLTQLQNNLGYGSAASAALGNLVTTQV